MVETIKLGTLKWHHIVSPSDEDLNYLKENFYFHPLDIEDCKSSYQRPKIDIYDDYYFMILHFPNFDRTNTILSTKEIKAFWGEDFVITISQSHWVVAEMFDETKRTLKRGDPVDIGTSDTLLYRILERLMQSAMNMIKKVGFEVEQISGELFNKKATRIIERISISRKNIILLNTIFKPQLPLFHKFESGQIKGFAENMESYWGNILDYYQKMWDMTEDYAEMIEGLSKTFDSMQANKINEIMKILTFMSTIMLPLTVITGFYGMNVGLPFQDSPKSFWIILVFMLIIVFSMLIYFRRKRWM
jgi:magnesium transporter